MILRREKLYSKKLEIFKRKPTRVPISLRKIWSFLSSSSSKLPPVPCACAPETRKLFREKNPVELKKVYACVYIYIHVCVCVYSHHRKGRCSTDKVAAGVTVADDGHRPPQWLSVDCGCVPPSRWPNGPIHRLRWRLGPCFRYRCQPYLRHRHRRLLRRLLRHRRPPRRPRTTRKRLSAR